MLPYVIIMNNRKLIDCEEPIFDVAKTISELKKIIIKYINEEIENNKDDIQYELNNTGEISFEEFVQIINGDAYDNSFYYSLKYFDSKQKIWIDYDVESIASKHFNNYIKQLLRKNKN